MGVLTSVLSFTSKLILFILFIALVPGLPPHMDFEAYSITPARPLKGSFAPNSLLNNAERLLEGEIHGPEDLQVHGGHLYMTLIGGHVAKLVAGRLEYVTKFGQPCEGFHEEEKCGRPLGMEFDNGGRLIVADAYYGLHKVDVKTGQYEQLVSTNETIEGKQSKLPNAVAVAGDGTIYWTDSSTSHYLHDAIFIGLGNGNGRLLRYDPKSKLSTVLKDNLHFPNGVALSGDGSFLVVCESMQYRLLKYHLKGSKAGQTETFIDGLPGMPDNVHRESKGNFVVTLVQARDLNDIPDILAQLPLVRKLLARLLYAVQATVALAHNVYPAQLLKQAVHMIGHFESLPKLDKRAAVVFLDKTGRVSRCLYATDGLLRVSAFQEFGGYYYLGSPVNHFLARVKAS